VAVAGSAPDGRRALESSSQCTEQRVTDEELGEVIRYSGELFTVAPCPELASQFARRDFDAEAWWRRKRWESTSSRL
jgi:hypothetical protein